LSDNKEFKGVRSTDLTFVDSPAEPGRKLSNLRNGINHVAFSPDGQTVATSDVHMSVHVVRDSEVLFTRSFNVWQDKIRPTQRVRGLHFSRDGKHLFLAAADTVSAISLATGDVEWSYTPPRSFGFLVISPLWLAASPNGDVAAVFDNGSVAVWGDGGMMKSLWHHNDAPRTIEFSTGGHSLIGTDSFSLTGWDWQTRKQTFKIAMPARVYAMSVSQVLPVVATRTLHGIHFWDLESKKGVGAMPVGFGLPVLAFSPTQPVLAYAERHAVMLADMDGRVIDQRPVPGAAVLSLAFAPDGSGVALGCSDNQVRHWRF
jgi:WD40 repeat protein